MKRISNQQGYTATAMVIMLAVGGILTAGAGRYAIRTSNENAGVALGAVLGQVNKAVGTYTVYNYKALVDGTLSLTPSITDLQAAGVLNANFPTTAPIGGGYAIVIAREPAGCVAPNCNLTSRVWYTQPLLNSENGRLDLAKLGAAAGAIGGDAGWSDNINPAVVRGIGGWSRANPNGNQPGTLMAINGYGSSTFAQYVDRAGTQGMLADFKMGGNNIVGASTVNAQQVILPDGDNLKIGSTWFHGDSQNGAVRTPGAMYIQHYDSSAASLNAANMNAEGTLSARNVTANASGQMPPSYANYYDISAGRIAAGKSLYSYDSICAGGLNGDCSGNGGVKMTAAGNLIASADVVGGQISSNGEVSTAGYFRTRNDGGWYSEKWNGGLYMSDGQWVRSYADKNMYTGGQMQAGSLQSNTDLTVNRNAAVVGNQTVGSQTVYGQQIVGGSQLVYGNISASSAVTPGQIASDGGNCVGNAGAIARDGNNNLYICN